MPGPSAATHPTRVLVTGVRGKTGSPLAELLAARAGVEVLGGSGDPATVTAAGVRPTAFSWDDPAGWRGAVQGVDAVYLVRPDRPDTPELVGALLDQVPPRAHVVLLSEQAADDPDPDGWAVRVERAVEVSGHSWTVLRPSWFMQVFTDPRFYRDLLAGGGELPFPDGGAAIAWIDARDIAAVAERALLEPGHSGRVHELTGPEALTLPRTAELLSGVAGGPVVHREVTVEEALTGTEGFDRDLLALTYDRVRRGSFTPVAGTVEQVTGRPARTLAAFLAEVGSTERPAAVPIRNTAETPVT
ncbi:NmrA family NAD(P)-binding protein [Modestobacter roseus]|uniref:NmrA family NAD(P)-binding protein n=1 Tax=Modestobacter roseus TaxID=1181884 RepID=UPI0034DF8F0E